MPPKAKAKAVPKAAPAAAVRNSPTQRFLPHDVHKNIENWSHIRMLVPGMPRLKLRMYIRRYHTALRLAIEDLPGLRAELGRTLQAWKRAYDAASSEMGWDPQSVVDIANAELDRLRALQQRLPPPRPPRE